MPCTLTLNISPVGTDVAIAFWPHGNSEVSFMGRCYQENGRRGCREGAQAEMLTSRSHRARGCLFSSSVCCSFSIPPQRERSSTAMCTSRIKAQGGVGDWRRGGLTPSHIPLHTARKYTGRHACSAISLRPLQRSGVAPTLVVGEADHPTFNLCLCPLLGVQ